MQDDDGGQFLTMQTKRQSLIESLANIAIGWIVAVLSQIAIFPIAGIEATLSQNIHTSIWFTAISLIRSYIVRRIFNARDRSDNA